MKKILITGGAGFIGSNLTDALLAKGYFVIAVDNLQTGFLRNIKHLENLKNFIFIKADVNNFAEISKIFSYHKPHFVFHYAAMVGVNRTLSNPISVFNDIDGIKNILELSRLFEIERVFFSSSSEVYGESADAVQNEDNTPLNSQLPYAIVKSFGESYSKAYQKEYGLNFTIFRFFNTYGPRQSLDFVVSKFISQALKNEDITIYGDGNQTRSFCYIDDNVQNTIAALNYEESVNEIINIGSDHEISMNKLAETIIKLSNSKSQIKYLTPRLVGDMKHRRPDISKMRSILKQGELLSLEFGLQKTIDWFKKFK